MKRIFTAILCAALIAITAGGCGVEDPLDVQSSSSATEQVTQSLVETVEYTDYEDSLDGLCKYFDALEYINVEKDTVTDMDASLIGAAQGKKFKHSSSVTIELYAYDENPDSTAKEIIQSVKSSGKFTILDLPAVTAYISDNEKYLMVYRDTSIDDEKPDENSSSFKKRAEAIENLKAFYK